MQRQTRLRLLLVGGISVFVVGMLASFAGPVAADETSDEEIRIYEQDTIGEQEVESNLEEGQEVEFDHLLRNPAELEESLETDEDTTGEVTVAAHPHTALPE